MKRFFFIAFFLLLAAISAPATEVTIGAYTSDVWRFGGSSAKIRAYLTHQIVTTDGKVLNPSIVGLGGWYREVGCTVSGTNLSCPAFTVDSTVDSSNPNAKYTFVFFDENGNNRGEFMTVKVPPSPVSTSFGALRVYTQSAIPAAATTYTKAEIDLQFAQLTDAAQKATQSTFGTLKITQPAADVNNPIAVGANDSAYLSQREHRFLKDYASLSAAVTAIGATATDLVCDDATSVSATLTVPKNVHFKPTADCLVTVASGQTLEIGSASLDNKKYFAGSGTVRFTKGAVEEINLAWFHGTDSATSPDITASLGKAITTLQQSYGGYLFIPSGDWTTTGGQSLPLISATIRGAGAYTSGGYATSITLTGNSAHIFKLDRNSQNIHIEDIAFKTAGTGNIGVLLEDIYDAGGSYNIGTRIRNSAFYGFAKGVSVNTGSGSAQDWNVEQFSVENTYFVLNGAAIHINTINSSLSFRDNYIIAPVATEGVGYDFEKTGTTLIEGGNILGDTLPSCAGGENAAGATGIRVRGDHIVITVSNVQDERLSIYLDMDADVGAPVVVENSLIQAPIIFNSAGIITSKGNRLPYKVFRDTPGADARGRVASYGDFVYNRDVCNEPANREFTANAGTDELSAAANHWIKNGDRVFPSSTGTLPAPLAFGTGYYAIVVSKTAIKLAATAALAEAGTAIDLTDTGTGTHTINVVPGANGFENGGQIVTEWSVNRSAIRHANLLEILLPESVLTAADPALSVGTPDADKILLRLGSLFGGSFTKYYDFRRDNASDDLYITQSGNTTPRLYLDGIGLHSTTGVTAPDLTSTNQLTANDVQMTGDVQTANITIGGGATITKVLSAAASLDFTALAANSCEDLDVTGFSGLSTGDVVNLGVPLAITNDSGSATTTTFFGFVKNATTVTVRRCNIGTVTTFNPSAATVRATVTQF